MWCLKAFYIAEELVSHGGLCLPPVILARKTEGCNI